MSLDMAKRLDSDVVGFRSTRGEALGRAMSIAAEAASDCLTFELTGPRRQDALARTEKMYRAPQSGPRWPAVAGPVERGVGPCWHGRLLCGQAEGSLLWALTNLLWKIVTHVEPRDVVLVEDVCAWLSIE